MSYTIALCLMLVAGESTVGDALASTRRSVFRAGFGTGAAVLTSSAPPATAAPATTIADRLSMPVLQQPGVKQPSLFGGQASLYADLFFPTWMQGEWQATSTLTGFEAPLGLTLGCRRGDDSSATEQNWVEHWAVSAQVAVDSPTLQQFCRLQEDLRGGRPRLQHQEPLECICGAHGKIVHRFCRKRARKRKRER